MTTTKYPNTELVAVSWLKNCVVPGVGVGTTLPEKNDTWAASGFVQVSSVGAGTANPYFMLEEPVVTVDAWATRPNSNKPPWGQAANLLATIRAAVVDPSKMNKVLTLQSGYPQARLMTVQFVMLPARIPDPSGYARYTCRLQLHWTTI